MHSGLVNPIDFSRQGRQAGHLAIPYSIDRSPYYQIRIPILRLSNGEGPSLLLMAGNHGDEYEGELQLARLMRLLDVTEIRGAVTILPMANLPAVMAAKRCSPFDGGNLNRAFPGDPMARRRRVWRISSNTSYFRAMTSFSTCIRAARRWRICPAR